MPYLQPGEVLSRFASFARHDVRSALSAEADESAFMRGQVGSMASTLDFLAGELRGMKPALDRQEAALFDAFDAVETRLQDGDVCGERAVSEALTEARTTIVDAPLAETPESLRERETALLTACETVLAAIDDLNAVDEARELRRPLYGFLDTRLDAQFRLLGREGTDE